MFLTVSWNLILILNLNLGALAQTTQIKLTTSGYRGSGLSERWPSLVKRQNNQNVIDQKLLGVM